MATSNPKRLKFGPDQIFRTATGTETDLIKGVILTAVGVQDVQFHGPGDLARFLRQIVMPEARRRELVDYYTQPKTVFGTV